LIVLAKISQIHLLSELCGDIIVPNGVVAEINVAVMLGFLISTQPTAMSDRTVPIL
jgi:predicted nucleic acid-binding protein